MQAVKFWFEKAVDRHNAKVMRCDEVIDRVACIVLAKTMCMVQRGYKGSTGDTVRAQVKVW